MVAMRRQAVHDDHILIRFVHQFGIDLIRWEDLLAFGDFILLAHAGPSIGVDHMRTFNSLMRIAHEIQLAAGFLGDAPGNLDRFRVQVIAFRAGQCKVPAEFGGDMH